MLDQHILLVKINEYFYILSDTFVKQIPKSLLTRYVLSGTIITT